PCICSYAPGPEHFGFMPLLDRDVEAGLQVPVDGGQWNCNVEGNAVTPSQDCLGVGADLISDFAGAPQSAIAADNHQINFSPLHQVSAGVVGDDLMGNVLLRQFP